MDGIEAQQLCNSRSVICGTERAEKSPGDERDFSSDFQNHDAWAREVNRINIVPPPGQSRCPSGGRGGSSALRTVDSVRRVTGYSTGTAFLSGAAGWICSGRPPRNSPAPMMQPRSSPCWVRSRPISSSSSVTRRSDQGVHQLEDPEGDDEAARRRGEYGEDPGGQQACVSVEQARRVGPMPFLARRPTAMAPNMPADAVDAEDVEGSRRSRACS